MSGANVNSQEQIPTMIVIDIWERERESQCQQSRANPYYDCDWYMREREREREVGMHLLQWSCRIRVLMH